MRTSFGARVNGDGSVVAARKGFQGNNFADELLARGGGYSSLASEQAASPSFGTPGAVASRVVVSPELATLSAGLPTADNPYAALDASYASGLSAVPNPSVIGSGEYYRNRKKETYS